MIMDKNSLERTIQNISEQISLAEASAGIYHTDKDENIHTVKNVYKRLDHFNEFLTRFTGGKHARVSSQQGIPVDATASGSSGPTHDHGWQNFLGCLNECDL